MQESVFSEAQHLIESWLDHSERNKQLSPPPPIHPTPPPDHYHLTSRSGGRLHRDTLVPYCSAAVTSELFPSHHPHHFSSSSSSPPPPPPSQLHPSTTDYWTPSSYRHDKWLLSNTPPHNTILPHHHPASNTTSTSNVVEHRDSRKYKNSKTEGVDWTGRHVQRFGVGGCSYKDDGDGDGGWREKVEEEESVESIMESLMKKPIIPLATGGGGGERRCQDPRVTMDMRHKQVRERRKARDEEKKRDKQRRQQLREAWREAERLVRDGEKVDGQRRKREEKMVAQEMEAIRRQVQEETERKRRDRLVGVATEKPHPSTNKMPGLSKREAVKVTAEEVVKKEDKEKEKKERREEKKRKEERDRRRRENRTKLVKQLEEAELVERKERSKILRRVLSEWYDIVSVRRTKTRRAVAWWAWHLMERLWMVWRIYVREKKERRERDRMTREIQRDKRMVSMAVKHYHYHLLRRCVGVWMMEVATEKRRREKKRDEARQRDRVKAFLSAAAASSSLITMREKEGERAGERVGQNEDDENKENCFQEHTVRAAVVVERNKRGDYSQEKISSTQPMIWRKARKQVDDLLSSVTPPITNEEVESLEKEDHTHKTKVMRSKLVVGSQRKREEEKEDEKKDGKLITIIESPTVWPVRPRSKPVTKPIPMSGMEARTEAMAERKRRREERERERQRKREEKEKREEEERREREQREKEAAVAKRREERILAKQREMEKMERQRREKEHTTLAVSHYTSHLMRSRGLGPWLQFMENMRRERKRACHFHNQWRMRSVVERWREEVKKREREREEAADQLHHRLIQQRVYHHWRDYMRECKRLEAMSEVWSRELLTRKVFRGWQRVTATARRESWEKERRAKIHHNVQLKRKMIKRWREYVPLVREEREREVRRAGLRRKVSQWLPDYQPLHFHQDKI